MALYKEPSFIGRVGDAVFDNENSPGVPAPYAGVYRCMGCGREIAIAEANTLPPQNHHEHTPQQGRIRWRLIVYADHRPH